MTPAEIETYRQRLLRIKRRMGGDLSTLENEALRHVGGEASGNLSNVPVHPADLGTDNYEEEFTLGLMERQSDLLQDVLDALERIKEGTFGRCEECGEEIPKERLNVVPYTRYCLRDAEQFQNENNPSFP